MMKKRVMFIVPGLYPKAIGGAEIFNYYLIRALREDCTVSYMTACEKSILGARKIQLHKNKNHLQQLRIILKLIGMTKANTIVHSFMRTKWYFIIIYPLLAMLFNKKYVIIIHGGGLMHWKWKLPYELYFRKAKAVFGVSETICEEYSNRTGEDVRFLPPLIPFNNDSFDKQELRRKYGYGNNDQIFLIVGSLKDLKRPMTVLEAAKKIGHQYLKDNNVSFIFAGDGHLRKGMDTFIDKNGLSACINLMGNVPRDIIHELYKMSNSYIISSDFEGTPIAMLEGMKNELLIIGSNVRGIKDTLCSDNLGFLFNNRKPAELAEIIKLAIHHDFSDKKLAAKQHYDSCFSYGGMLSDIKDVL
ncbi:MAG: hypothetical protein COA86_15170 [Kangiella sp.]|nr:MAG: hypothetical protein COA86_15170 [Kangiella sp.]